MKVLMVRAFDIAEMAMKIGVVLGVVVNRNGSDSLVDDDFANSVDRGERIANLFEGRGITLGGRHADAQSSLAVVGDFCAVRHGNSIGPSAGRAGRRCGGLFGFGRVVGASLSDRILHLLGGFRH